MGNKIPEMGCTSQMLWDVANSGSSWGRMFVQPQGAWGQKLLHPGGAEEQCAGGCKGCACLG